MPPKTVKCVVIGDGAVGKTCMLVSYATNRFPTDHVPTVFDHYDVTVMAGDEPYQIGLWDTAGQAEFDRLRVMSYPGTDVILVCFSVVSPDSFNNVSEVWIPEIRQHCPNAPFLLVGTQSDRRDDEELLLQLAKRRKKPVPREQAEKLAKTIGAEVFVECSALTHIGLKEVFDEAIMAVLEPREPEPRKSYCCFLCGIKR